MSRGEANSVAMVGGVRKMPEPMMTPIMTATPPQKPMERFRSGGGVVGDGTGRVYPRGVRFDNRAAVYGRVGSADLRVHANCPEDQYRQVHRRARGEPRAG